LKTGILGSFLLKNINRSAMTMIPGEAARAADDVQEKEHGTKSLESKIRLVFTGR
jgi:hypothetical protein